MREKKTCDLITAKVQLRMFHSLCLGRQLNIFSISVEGKARSVIFFFSSPKRSLNSSALLVLGCTALVWVELELPDRLGVIAYHDLASLFFSPTSSSRSEHEAQSERNDK
jgi:hypothetical protein